MPVEWLEALQHESQKHEDTTLTTRVLTVLAHER